MWVPLIKEKGRLISNYIYNLDMRSKGELRMTSTMAKQKGVKVEAKKR